MTIDGKALAKALVPLGGTAGKDGAMSVATHLCRRQMEAFQDAAGIGDPLLVACTQEAPLFLETLGDMGPEAPDARFVNIREKAGWSDAAKDRKSAANVTAKMAALLAEAAMDLTPTRSVTMKSSGVLLVVGRDEAALEAARKLSGRLSVTCLLEKPGDVAPPAVVDVPLFTGRITGAGGHLGAFKVSIADFRPAKASARGGLEWEGAGQAGTSECDLILDLRGGPAMFPHADRRDGYFHPDPGNPALVAEALFQLADMVGEFEKPRYVDYDGKICAHSRNRIAGCTRCIDNCPAGAITPDGDQVRIDPYLCGGCGVCASVCPTGAATYAVPAGEDLFKRARTLIGSYQKAGGSDPMILIHDQDEGTQAIGLMARYGRGLPGNVLPFAVNEVTQAGVDLMFTCLSLGAGRVMVLLPAKRRAEAQALDGEIALAETVMTGLGYASGRVQVIHLEDPTAVEETLWSLPKLPAMPSGDFLPMGRKRAIMRLALESLHAQAPSPVDEIAVPAGAPFGTITVDAAGCTLCLACVGACPARALRDNPDKPQLSFVEDACVQCGLCAKTCPEKVITLTPRLSFRAEAKSPRVQNEEDPFHCIRCGKPYGARATIERMTAKLKGHAMFGGKALDRIKMCDNCRVLVQFDEPNPLAGAERPRTRTTEDYLREREEMKAQAQADMKAKGLAPNSDS